MQRATYEKINRAVIFDRDGVINKLIPTSYGWTSPKNIDEFEWKPNIFDAVSMLRKYNFKIFVIPINQVLQTKKPTRN